MIPAAYGSSGGSPTVPVSRPIAAISISRPAIAISWAVIITSVSPVPAVSVIAPTIVAVPVIPGASTDKNAPYKVGWAVVTIRGASVRVISIVPIGADGGCPDSNSDGTDTNAH